MGSVPEIHEPARPGAEWQDSPIFKGTTKFEPHPDVKSIMITGGAGFIASWLARHLTLTYPTYHIISFDKLDYCATLNNTRVLDAQPNFTFHYGNVTEIQDVMRCLTTHKVDTIFHFAAQSHVDLSFGNSFEFTKTNVHGTHVMVESAVKTGVRRFIHVSTDEVNGEVSEGDPDLLEDSLLAPTNPYAASKAAAEMYVNAYAKSFKLPAIIVRSNNVYGPHQFPEKIIPKFASLLHRRRPLILHGAGTNTRRYLYAADAVDAFDTVLHAGRAGEVYNVGSRDEVSNVELARRMLGIFGLGSQRREEERGKEREEENGWIVHVRDRPFNDRRYAIDARKLMALGWVQRVGLDEGLRVTVEWYRRFGQGWWGDVEGVLTAFPEVGRDGGGMGGIGIGKEEETVRVGLEAEERGGGFDGQGRRDRVGGIDERFLGVRPEARSEAGSNTVVEGAAAVAAGNVKRKRMVEPEGKENLEGGRGGKRLVLGECVE